MILVWSAECFLQIFHLFIIMFRGLCIILTLDSKKVFDIFLKSNIEDGVIILGINVYSLNFVHFLKVFQEEVMAFLFLLIVLLC